MSSFESPLGNKKMGQGVQLREFNVPDESEIPITNPLFKKNMENKSQFRNEPQYHNESSPQHFANESRTFNYGVQEEQSLAEIEREFQEARKEKISGKQKLTEGAKKRLEALLNMTKTTHDVDVDGTLFILQTLSSKSMREAIMKASEYDGTVQGPFEIRRQFLARSLIQIAGVDFTQFVGSDELEARLIFIDEMDEPLINKLYSEYLNMTKKAKDKFSIKNQEEAKEVLEDLKK